MPFIIHRSRDARGRGGRRTSRQHHAHAHTHWSSPTKAAVRPTSTHGQQQPIIIVCRSSASQQAKSSRSSGDGGASSSVSHASPMGGGGAAGLCHECAPGERTTIDTLILVPLSGAPESTTAGHPLAELVLRVWHRVAVRDDWMDDAVFLSKALPGGLLQSRRVTARRKTAQLATTRSQLCCCNALWAIHCFDTTLARVSGRLQ